MKTNNKGFSLVELIVVIAIMAILAAVAIPTFSGFITKAQISNDVSFVNDVTYAAKVASVEITGADVAVAVTVGSDKTAATVVITKGSFTATIEEGEVTNVTEGYATIADDINACIDWTYKFAKYTAADGSLTLATDGKTLVGTPADEE